MKNKNIDNIKAKAKPGFSDTWMITLQKKGDENTLKFKALEEGRDLKKPFPLTFSSHPGLGVVRG